MDLPAIDAHAHIDTTVTARQLGALGSAIILAMTREPAEAAAALRRNDRNILWACGAHPAYVAKGGDVDLAQFARRVSGFAVVGEVGIDRRSGNVDRQTEVFVALLDAIRDEPVLVSVHSAGCTAEVLEVVRSYSRPGLIAHWFNGTHEQAAELVSLGCYFSVNTVMRREILDALPLDHVLPETDFPVARRRTGARPGDVQPIERLLCDMHDLTRESLRRQMLRNLRRISLSSGALDRMPLHVAEQLLMA